jgi:hypothetical protein
MPFRAAAFVLTLLAALSAGLGGVVRAQAMVSGPGPGFEMVICTEGGAKTIRVDAAGDPIPPADEHCPCPCLDCLPAAEAAVLPEAARSAMPTAASAPREDRASTFPQPQARRMRPEARGPPSEAKA